MGCRECYYFPCTKPVCIMGNKEGCDNFMSISSKEIRDISINAKEEELVVESIEEVKDLEIMTETQNNIKIKLFSSKYYCKLEDQINDFIKDKTVIDIKMSYRDNNENIIVLVLYKEVN